MTLLSMLTKTALGTLIAYVALPYLGVDITFGQAIVVTALTQVVGILLHQDDGPTPVTINITDKLPKGDE